MCWTGKCCVWSKQETGVKVATINGSKSLFDVLEKVVAETAAIVEADLGLQFTELRDHRRRRPGGLAGLCEDHTGAFRERRAAAMHATSRGGRIALGAS